MKVSEFSTGRILLLVSIVTASIINVGTAESAEKTPSPNQNQTDENKGRSSGEKLDRSGTFGNFGNLTIDLDSDDTVTLVKKKTKHNFSINYIPNVGWFIQCRGENITSLSAMSCYSLGNCEKYKACLFDENKCSWDRTVQNGWDCNITQRRSHNYGYGNFRSSSGSNGRVSSCFHIDFYSLGDTGIVQCTSQEDGLNVTTFDHYTMDYPSSILLSSVKNVSTDFMEMKLYVASLKEDLNNKTAFGEGAVMLYENEEVTLLRCDVPRFLFPGDALFISVYRRDGSTVKLGERMIKTEGSFYSRNFFRTKLSGFRVPKDVVAFSCSALRTNSSAEWVEKRINVTVREIPSKVVVKSVNSSNMTLNLTSGSKVNLHCELTGSLELKARIKDRMRRKLFYINYKTEGKSNSTLEFLRFHQVAGDHLCCKDLDKDYSPQLDSKWKIDHENRYGKEQEYHVIFRLGASTTNTNFPSPSVPKISKPSSSIFVIYPADENMADQTVFCSFDGEPKPRVTWMKNSLELFSEKLVWDPYHSDFTNSPETTTPAERVQLGLGAKTIQPTDFKPGENGREYVNLSCITRNQFGSDRLDFIITRSDEFTRFAENPKAQAEAGSETETVSKTMAFLTIFIVQDLLLILGLFIFWRKTSAQFHADANAGAVFEESGEILRLRDCSLDDPDKSRVNTMRNGLIDDQ